MNDIARVEDMSSQEGVAEQIVVVKELNSYGRLASRVCDERDLYRYMHHRAQHIIYTEPMRERNKDIDTYKTYIIRFIKGLLGRVIRVIRGVTWICQSASFWSVNGACSYLKEGCSLDVTTINGSGDENRSPPVTLPTYDVQLFTT